MKKNYFKNIILMLFLVISFVIIANKNSNSSTNTKRKLPTLREVEENFDMNATLREHRKELRKYKINEKSIELYEQAVYGSYNEREKKLLEAIKLDNKNFFAYYLLGAYYELNERNNNKAIEYYKKGLEINSEHGFSVYDKLGNIYLAERQYENAMSLFSRGLKYFPKSPKPYFDMAILSLKVGKIENVIMYSQKSIEKSNKEYPQDNFERESQKMPAHVTLIRGYFLSQQYEKGFKHFFDVYSDMADIVPDEALIGVIDLVVSENEKIKNTHKNIYEQNIKKFKDLEIIK